MAPTTPTGTLTRSPFFSAEVSRLVVILAAVALAGGVAACSLNSGPPPPLTADEWAWCQGHWRDGLDASQRVQPAEGDWYFNHMGMRDNPDTVRVCRAAAALR